MDGSWLGIVAVVVVVGVVLVRARDFDKSRATFVCFQHPGTVQEGLHLLYVLQSGNAFFSPIRPLPHARDAQNKGMHRREKRVTPRL